MTGTTEHPRVFISYSWTDAEHEQFVLELATALRGHGVDAILDKWDLKAGQDKYAFMESMVTDANVGKVLVVCDRRYQEKADARAGGVGTESQIISQELYAQVQQTKFIPLVREYAEDGQPCLPVFLKSRIFVDVSTDEKYGEGLMHVLRLIYDQPFHERPRLGAPPPFLTSDGGAGYVRELASTIRAIQDAKPNRAGLQAMLIRGFVAELDALYVTPEGAEYDEEVYQAVARTKGLRDQFSDYMDTVAAFSGDDVSTLAPFVKLMEELGSRFGPSRRPGGSRPGWQDLYTFVALEFFLIATASLLRHYCWRSLHRILTCHYVVQDTNGQLSTKNYAAFDTNQEALHAHRNARLKLNRVSLTADLLKERASSDKTPFSEILQADLFLMLNSVVHFSENEKAEVWDNWRARTTIYSTGAQHPVFLRAADGDVRAGIRTALGVSSGPALASKIDAARSRLDSFRSLAMDRFNRFNFESAINLAQLTK